MLRRVGKAPKCAFLFKTDEPFDKLLVGLWPPGKSRPEKLGDCKHRIEILGSGQQVVVDGIHPDTKLPYAWMDGEPWTVRRDDLPSLTGADAGTFMADAKKLLTSLGWGLFETKERDERDGNQPHLVLELELAERLWGKPIWSQGTDYRFGTHGSKALDLRTGRWFDFEIYEGGGIRELMQMVSSAKRLGQLCNLQVSTGTARPTRRSIRSGWCKTSCRKPEAA